GRQGDLAHRPLHPQPRLGELVPPGWPALSGGIGLGRQRQRLLVQGASCDRVPRFSLWPATPPATGVYPGTQSDMAAATVLAAVPPGPATATANAILAVDKIIKRFQTPGGVA